MSKVILSRIISDNKDPNITFAIPDMVELMRMHATPGDEVYIPVNVRKGEITFWESGGRNDKFVSSLGTVIASSNDSILDAILFNKLNKEPNGKHALIALKKGYHIYAGKISVRHNTLAPKIKIFRLIYTDIDQELSDDPEYSGTYGKFIIDELFRTVGETNNCPPASRLVTKLFTKNVCHPYYANGWSASDISNISNKAGLVDAYMKIMRDDTEAVEMSIGDDFLDTVEETIVNLNNKRLSAAFQYIDFNTGIMSIRPLTNIKLSDIIGTIHDAKVAGNFSIKLEDMKDAYNDELLFSSDDLSNLRMALKHDDAYSIELVDGIFCILRGYRG